MFALVFGSVFGVCGLTCLLVARATFAKDRAIAAWPRAPGRIESASIASETGTARDREGYETTYRVHHLVVRYHYTVDGRIYPGDRVARFAPPTSRPPDLARYPAGAAVSVYYDPRDPSLAYLEVRRSGAAVLLAAMGAGFLAIGVLVAALMTFA